jgi:hypothetical protein
MISIQKILSCQYKTELEEQILKVFHSCCFRLHNNYYGNKIYTNYQQMATIILFMRSKKSLRDFTKEFKETRWIKWLGLKEIPSKSSLHRWLKRWNMKKLRKLLNAVIAKEKPKIMAIDATGFDSWQRSRHYEKRIKAEKMPYAKADILIDVNTKLIHDAILRIKPRHDVLGAESIFKRMKKKKVLILADKGYDSEKLHLIAKRKGNILFAPVRDFKVKKPKGKNRRRCTKGNFYYFKRNLVESVNFSLKSRFSFLRSKLHFMKKREFMWRVITYNLERLSNCANMIFKIIFQFFIWDRA